MGKYFTQYHTAILISIVSFDTHVPKATKSSTLVHENCEHEESRKSYKGHEAQKKGKDYNGNLSNCFR